MLFNSYEYLLYFLPITAIGYFAFGRRAQWAVGWLVVTSLVFYGWWNPRYLPLIIASIGFNFGVAHLMMKRAVDARRWLIVGVTGNLALLGVFKYSDFFLRMLGEAGVMPLWQSHLALPLGISFFTFTQIAFLVDVSRRKATEPSPANYSLFVTFFPHLLSGPIIHHSEMMPQFASSSNKQLVWENVGRGMFLLVIGLSKKIFLADPLAPLVADGFDHAAGVGGFQAWLSAFSYTLQIYFDFSGYTDMALGAALIFNIRLPINFNSPYRSSNLRDFWYRWHITLSRFLREYLYIPLGGNRVPEARVFANLLVTFLLGGLWHGAGWTFVCWGALHGLGLCCLRLWNRTGLRLPPVVAWMITFLFVVVTWVFFRANSVADALDFLRAMAGLSAPVGTSGTVDIRDTVATLAGSQASALLSLIAGTAIVFQRKNSNTYVQELSPSWVFAAGTAAALVAAVLQLSDVAPFLYFNF